MNIRNKLNNNPAAATIGAVVLLVICSGVMLYTLSGGGRAGPDSVYFFDAEEGTVFTATPERGPIAAPSQGEDPSDPKGFRARLYACGECGDYDGMTMQEVKDAGGSVVYITRSRNPDAKQQQQGPGGGTLMSEPDPIKWVGMMGPAAADISKVELNCSDSDDLTICLP